MELKRHSFIKRRRNWGGGGGKGTGLYCELIYDGQNGKDNQQKKAVSSRLEDMNFIMILLFCPLSPY